jgi:hypothetical protein
MHNLKINTNCLLVSSLRYDCQRPRHSTGSPSDEEDHQLEEAIESIQEETKTVEEVQATRPE